MKPVYVSVLQEETGKRIRSLMDGMKLKATDLQEACGLGSAQAVYKWFKGKSLPSLDNMVVLSEVLNTPIDSILVISGDASFFFCNQYFM